MPHSDQLKITERYRRTDARTLKVDVTLTDPLYFIKYRSTTVIYTALRDRMWEPHEFLCTPHTDYHPERYIH